MRICEPKLPKKENNKINRNCHEVFQFFKKNVLRISIGGSLCHINRNIDTHLWLFFLKNSNNWQTYISHNLRKTARKKNSRSIKMLGCVYQNGRNWLNAYSVLFERSVRVLYCIYCTLPLSVLHWMGFRFDLCTCTQHINQKK